MKSTSRLTGHLNTCKDYLYSKPSYKPPRHKSYNKKDVLGGNWEDKSDLFNKTVTIAIVNSTFKMPTEDKL